MISNSGLPNTGYDIPEQNKTERELTYNRHIWSLLIYCGKLEPGLIIFTYKYFINSQDQFNVTLVCVEPTNAASA